MILKLGSIGLIFSYGLIVEDCQNWPDMGAGRINCCPFSLLQKKIIQTVHKNIANCWIFFLHNIEYFLSQLTLQYTYNWTSSISSTSRCWTSWTWPSDPYRMLAICCHWKGGGGGGGHPNPSRRDPATQICYKLYLHWMRHISKS